MTIGEKIKQRRIELGMTQEELAKKIGYKGKVSISKIESGERPLRQSKIIPMTKALNLTVGYLLGIDDSAPAEPVVVVSDTEKRLKSYMEKLEMLNSEGLKRASEYLDFLTENKKFVNNDDSYKKSVSAGGDKK